jgi:hypothetical protein
MQGEMKGRGVFVMKSALLCAILPTVKELMIED